MGKSIGIASAVVVLAAVLGASGVFLWQMAEQRGRVAREAEKTPPPAPPPSPAPPGPAPPGPASPSPVPLPAAPVTGGTGSNPAPVGAVTASVSPASKVETPPQPKIPNEPAPALVDPAISVHASAVSGVTISPITLKGFPKLRSARLTVPGKYFSPVQETRNVGETMLLEPGEYDV